MKKGFILLYVYVYVYGYVYVYVYVYVYEYEYVYVYVYEFTHLTSWTSQHQDASHGEALQWAYWKI